MKTFPRLLIRHSLKWKRRSVKYPHFPVNCVDEKITNKSLSILDTMNKTKLIVGVLLLATAFIIGRLSINFRYDKASPATRGSVQFYTNEKNQMSSRGIPRLPDTDVLEKKHTGKTLNISESLLLRQWRPPSFNYTNGLFEISSLMSYGINSEKAKALQQQISTLIEEIKKEEVENSTLTTDPDGGQFFSIKPFPAAGIAVKKKLEEAINDAFDVEDDRSKLLSLGLCKHPAFSNFGKDKMEVAIEEQQSPDGVKTISYVVRSYFEDGKVTINKALPAGLKYVSERFKLLSDKHLKVN